MTATILQLTRPGVTQDDVLRAWATYRAMLLAEASDPRLREDPAHQAAKAEAEQRYLRTYNEWVRH